MSTAGRKIFVGSLPSNIEENVLSAIFEQYGQVESVFIKPNCEPGRQWAFVTFALPDQAQAAKEACDRTLSFPGCDRPCDVMVARNQGMFGQADATGAQATPAVASSEGPTKVFVGSLPDDITDAELRTEFSKYGAIADIFLKSGCESGRQWAFVNYRTAEEAQLAKQSTDRILQFPGSLKPCEVMLARNQGMYGQDPVSPAPAQLAPALSMSTGPKKIFVGSLPDNISEPVLREEFEKYGQIVDIFVKAGCESGRQWAFISYVSPESASLAKDATDRILQLPGAERPCEVMLARNQGKFGQEPVTTQPAAGAQGILAGASFGQPPPPTAPPPAHLSPWRCYYTAAGLPYYHNHITGVTQWEAPLDLLAPGQSQSLAMGMALAAQAGVRYSPY
mmetsp:Transcript_70972/g.154221  ORF Transcript_70972/g.154221 Transcript_70972/m.154221 type:complete len:393 (-) Transcript_70972:54-1232(-)